MFEGTDILTLVLLYAPPPNLQTFILRYKHTVRYCKTMGKGPKWKHLLPSKVNMGLKTTQANKSQILEHVHET